MRRVALAVLLASLLGGSALAAEELPADGVSLVYFHATLRCQTCLGLEANIDRCVKDEFSVELAEGWLDWRSLNHEIGENRALVEALGIEGSELVVIRWQGGEPVDWTLIPEVWEAPDADGVCAALTPIVAGTLRAQFVPEPDEDP